MPVPGRAVGAVITVHAVKDGTTAYVLLGNFTVTTAGFVSFPVSDLCWEIGHAPTVISTSPANGATNVPVNSKITATFSELMNPASLDIETFKVRGPGGTPVSGTVTYADGTATFTPAGNLASGTTYTARIEVEAENEAHNRLTRKSDGLESEYEWTFTTTPTGTTTVQTQPQRTPHNYGHDNGAVDHNDADYDNDYRIHRFRRGDDLT